MTHPNVITGSIPPYAGGLATVRQASAGIDSHGNFSIHVDTIPSTQTIILTPPAGAPYMPLSLSVTLAPGTTNITPQIKDALAVVGPSLGLPGSPLRDVAGSNTQVQWNNDGTLAGAAGLLTDGDHSALGVGASIDGGATTGPLFATNAGAATIATMSETSTTAEGVNGLFVEVTNSPVGAPTSSSPYGAWIDVEYNADATTGSTQLGPTGAVISVNLNSNTVGTHSSAYGLFTQVNNNGNADCEIMSSIYTNDSTSGTGDLLAEYNGINQNFYQGSTGTTGETVGLATGVVAAAGVIKECLGVKIYGPQMLGGTVNNSFGLWMDEMAGDAGGAGVGSAFQIYSVGTSPSLFFGTMIFAMQRPGDTALQLSAAAEATADIAQFSVKGNPTPVSRINNVGQFVLATTSGAPTNAPTPGACAFDPATNTLYIYGSSGWKSTVLS